MDNTLPGRPGQGPGAAFPGPGGEAPGWLVEVLPGHCTGLHNQE